MLASSVASTFAHTFLAPHRYPSPGLPLVATTVPPPAEVSPDGHRFDSALMSSHALPTLAFCFLVTSCCQERCCLSFFSSVYTVPHALSLHALDVPFYHPVSLCSPQPAFFDLAPFLTTSFLDRFKVKRRATMNCLLRQQ